MMFSSFIITQDEGTYIYNKKPFVTVKFPFEGLYHDTIYKIFTSKVKYPIFTTRHTHLSVKSVYIIYRHKPLMYI